MKQSLFITEDLLKEYSPLSGSLDFEYMKAHIVKAQDMYLQPVLGMALYDRLNEAIYEGSLTANETILVDDYIGKYLVHTSILDATMWLVVKMENSGIVTKNINESSSITLTDARELEKKSIVASEFYKQRLINYLNANASLYPEYNEASLLTKSDNNYNFGYNFGKKKSKVYTTGSGEGGKSANYTESETAPVNPFNGDVWLCTLDSNCYMFFSDSGGGSGWVDWSNALFILGGGEYPSVITADSALFNPSYTGLTVLGELSYSEQNRCLTLNKGNGILQNLGESNDALMQNSGVNEVPRGLFVRIIGYDEVTNKYTGGLSDYGNPDYAYADYVVAETIMPFGGVGIVTKIGKIVGVNTSDGTIGQPVYLGAYGRFTPFVPTSPNKAVIVGTYGRIDSVNGEIFVNLSKADQLSFNNLNASIESLEQRVTALELVNFKK